MIWIGCASGVKGHLWHVKVVDNPEKVTDGACVCFIAQRSGIDKGAPCNCPLMILVRMWYFGLWSGRVWLRVTAVWSPPLTSLWLLKSPISAVPAVVWVKITTYCPSAKQLPHRMINDLFWSESCLGQVINHCQAKHRVTAYCIWPAMVSQNPSTPILWLTMWNW